MVDSAIDHFGTVGMLVNNAGAAQIARTWEMPEEEWHQTIDVCLNGPFHCTKAVLDHMLDRGIEGSIVNISSLNYAAATDGLPHYSAAKAGVSQFTKVVAAEMGWYGIRVNAVVPGSTRTPLTEENGLLEGKIGEEFLDRTPLVGWANPRISQRLSRSCSRRTRSGSPDRRSVSTVASTSVVCTATGMYWTRWARSTSSSIRL